MGDMSAVPSLPPDVEGYRIVAGRPARHAAENRYWDRRRDESTSVAHADPPGVEGYSVGRGSGDVASGHG